MKRAVKILGTGHVLPRQEVLSSDLDNQLGLPQGKLESVGGVHKRYFASKDEYAAKLAAAAAIKALATAGLKLSDIDCLVATSATMDQGMPSNAALIHAELGLSHSAIPAFDINASCLGFLAALDSITWMISAGAYKRVLVVAADLASCGLNWDHLESSAIFGDGAAAVVLGSGEIGSQILASSLNLKTAVHPTH